MLCIIFPEYSQLFSLAEMQFVLLQAISLHMYNICMLTFQMIKMMIVVVLLYAVCWLPCHVLYIIGDADDSVFLWDDIKYVWNAGLPPGGQPFVLQPICVYLDEQTIQGRVPGTSFIPVFVALNLDLNQDKV